MKNNLLLVLFILLFATIKAKADKGCYQNENQRIYYKYVGGYKHTNGKTYPAYANKRSYALSPENCPGAELIKQQANGICFVGRNRGTLWIFNPVTECNLDDNVWFLIIPAGAIGFAVARKKR